MDGDGRQGKNQDSQTGSVRKLQKVRNKTKELKQRQGLQRGRGLAAAPAPPSAPTRGLWREGGRCWQEPGFDLLSLPQNVELPDTFSPELKSLLEGLLQREVSQRLGCHGGG